MVWVLGVRGRARARAPICLRRKLWWEEQGSGRRAAAPVYPHTCCPLLPLPVPPPLWRAEHPDPNTSEAHLEVWLQQVSKRWSEVPHMAEAIKKVGGLLFRGI